MAARKASRFWWLATRLKGAQGCRTLEELGFDPVDARGIEESWRQQPGTPCYTQDYNAVQLKAALATAVRSRVPEYRKAADDAAKWLAGPCSRR